MRNLVYKVVHVEGCDYEQRVSAFVSHESETRTEYPVGKEVTPKIGKLFAFSSLKDAEYFAGVIADAPNEIWQAKATGVSRPNFPFFVSQPSKVSSRGFLELFWSRRFNEMLERLEQAYHFSPPRSTVICSSIKLLTQVS